MVSCDILYCLWLHQRCLQAKTQTNIDNLRHQNVCHTENTTLSTHTWKLFASSVKSLTNESTSSTTWLATGRHSDASQPPWLFTHCVTWKVLQKKHHTADFYISNACFLHQQIITRILHFCLRLMFLNIRFLLVLFLMRQYWILTVTKLSYQAKRSQRMNTMKMEAHERQVLKKRYFNHETKEFTFTNPNFISFILWFPLSSKHQTASSLNSRPNCRPLIIHLGKRQISSNFSTRYQFK